MTSRIMNIERKGKNMAKVELPSGIAAIHGRLGNMVFRSRKQADGTYKVFVHEYVPKKKIISRKRQVVGS